MSITQVGPHKAIKNYETGCGLRKRKVPFNTESCFYLNQASRIAKTNNTFYKNSFPVTECNCHNMKYPSCKASLFEGYCECGYANCQCKICEMEPHSMFSKLLAAPYTRYSPPRQKRQKKQSIHPKIVIHEKIPPAVNTLKISRIQQTRKVNTIKNVVPGPIIHENRSQYPVICQNSSQPIIYQNSVPGHYVVPNSRIISHQPVRVHSSPSPPKKYLISPVKVFQKEDYLNECEICKQTSRMSSRIIEKAGKQNSRTSNITFQSLQSVGERSAHQSRVI